MIVAANPFSFREHAFVWTLLLSMGLHGVLMASKGFDLSQSRPVDSLIIQLQPVMEPPPPPPQPEQPKPKPQPPKAPKINPQPSPTPVPELTTPEPLEQPAPSQPQPAPAPQPAPSPEVVSVAPQAEATPTFTAPPPPPEPPKVQGPSQQDLDAARASYSKTLGEAIQKYLKYPRIAEMRRIQGKAHVWVKFDEKGNVLQTRIEKSSGFDVLDRQALETVKNASPLPMPPAILRTENLAVLVPVDFKLPDR